jgi:hypothetical protein
MALHNNAEAYIAERQNVEKILKMSNSFDPSWQPSTGIGDSTVALGSDRLGKSAMSTFYAQFKYLNFDSLTFGVFDTFGQKT